MDLINREALLNDMCEDREEGTFCFTDSQAEAADKIIAYFTKRIRVQPSVPAVPLDKLCEWLGNLANPCKIGIRCYYPDDNDHDCMPTVECWRYVLTKWMEGLDDGKESV